MEPLVVSYLKTHSFQQLEDDHGVCSRAATRGDKVSLNYDQIMVKNGDRLAEQCRGMVVGLDGWVAQGVDWKQKVVGDVRLLAWPMDRFYNLGDPAAADLDWTDPDLRVYEKLDGTMIVTYWDPIQARWHAATRAVPEADLPIHKDHMEIGDTTFSELFFDALKKTREATSAKALKWTPVGFDQVVHLNKGLTYVFELTTPFNRVVVKYDEPRVTLLAARHTVTGAEIPIESLRLQHVQRPKTWDLRSASALEAFVDSSDPAQLEGAVACVRTRGGSFVRLKVKNKAWVLSSRAKDLVTVSRRSAIFAIIKGEIDDVLPLVEKNIADELTAMQERLQAYLRSVDAAFADFKEQAGNDRKTFAILVTSSGDWTPAYFNMWEGRTRSAREWVTGLATAGKLSDTALDIILSKVDRKA